MRKEDVAERTLQFERALHDMRVSGSIRHFNDDDIKTLQWITRNLRRLRDCPPDSLTWDDAAKEVIVYKVVTSDEKTV